MPSPVAAATFLRSSRIARLPMSGRGASECLQNDKPVTIVPRMEAHEVEADYQACSRNACKAPAVATLICNYMARRVALEDLRSEIEPDQFHLCTNHLRRFSPPLGWQTEDLRSKTVSLEIPAGSRPARASA